MATNPFGRPGTSVSGGQGEAVYSKNNSFADALRNLAQSSAFGTADNAANRPVQASNMNNLTGQQRLSADAISAGLSSPSTPSTGNALDNMRPLATGAPSPAAAGASFGGASKVGAALQGAATAPPPGANSAAAPGGASNTGAQGTATTPFGQSFNRNTYGMAWDNPKAMIQQYFNFNKMPLHSGGLAMAQQQADSMKLLYALMNGGQGPGVLDFGHYLDWADNYLKEGMTPGGHYFTPQQVISAIAHPDPKSSIFNLYYGADLTPDQQVGNVLSGLRYGLQGSMPAPMLASLLSRAQELGDKFQGWRMTQPDGGFTFGDYLRQQDPQTFGNL